MINAIKVALTAFTIAGATWFLAWVLTDATIWTLAVWAVVGPGIAWQMGKERGRIEHDDKNRL